MILPLGHEFVPPPFASGYAPDQGCAFIVRGREWTASDPVCCRKPKVAHAPVSRLDFETTRLRRVWRAVRQAVKREYGRP